jgi:hypothetical protein
MISEIFSTSFLFSVAIIIIAVGGLFAYFNYRLSEHNHKMQAMMGLVSTMAEEMQYFRSKIHSNPMTTNNTDTTHIVSNFLGGSNKEDDLIEVSDSEIEEDDEEEEDDEAESLDEDLEEDLEDDDLEDDDLEEEDLDEDLEEEDLEAEDLEAADKKIITIDIDLGATNEMMSFDSEEIEDTNTNANDLNLSNLEDLDVSLKSIAIDMDISNISSNKEKDDYKKMSLNKLRDLVCEKGLVKDASKLKKNELLKLLGAE